MPHKVLVIDDDIAITETLKVLLNAVGYEAHVAGDGESGISKAKEIIPDIILLDLLLPNQDGFEVYREIRGIENLANVPIIVLSSFAEKPVAPDGTELDLPPDMFMAKPIDPGILLQKMKILLQD